MDPIDYLRALRRWWVLILGLTLVGALGAFVTSGGAPAASYQSTTILAQDGDGNNTVGLARSAFLATSSDVSNRVAKELGEDPRVVAEGVSAVPDTSLNGVVIMAIASSPQRADKVSSAFGKALIASLEESAQEEQTSGVAELTRTIAGLQAQLSAANLASSQTSRLQDQLTQAQTDLANLQASDPSSGLSVLQPAKSSATGGSTSRTVRVAIGTIMGLLAGIVAALVLARFDTRIRTKEGAESAFGFPVLAEVPSLKRSMRSKRAIIAIVDPESLGAEVYRGLRTALVVSTNVAANSRGPSRARAPRRRSPEAPPAGQPGPLVVVVASPGMGEGKTTTSANLAVAFAESGKRVLMLGCDLRRPELHNYLGVAESPGLTEELAKPHDQQSWDHIVEDTEVAGVRIAPSGTPVEHPGELLTRNIEFITSARDIADVVVIDTAPLLATDDASVLIPLADAVVVVCRAGVTSLDAASRARELLERLHAPVTGVVLIGADQLASARSYYRVDYRSRTGSTSAPTPSVPWVEAPLEDAGSSDEPELGGADEHAAAGSSNTSPADRRDAELVDDPASERTAGGPTVDQPK